MLLIHFISGRTEMSVKNNKYVRSHLLISQLTSLQDLPEITITHSISTSTEQAMTITEQNKQTKQTAQQNNAECVNYVYSNPRYFNAKA